MVPFQSLVQDPCRFIFQNTNNNLNEGIGEDSGDSNNNGLNFGKSKHCHNRVQGMKNESKTDLQLNNLASGDYNVTFLKSKTKHKMKSKSCVNTTNNSSKTAETFEGNKKNKGLETIYENKNVIYDSDTDSFGLMSCPSLPKKDNDSENVLSKSIKIFPRPVRCPVLECRKMVAMDAVMLHFYFDHSKIGRITLNLRTPEQTHIKSSFLSENTQCLMIFSLQNNGCKEADVVDSRVLLNEFRKQDCPLLLMAARVQTDTQKYSQRTYSSSSRSPLLCHVATQTECFVDNLSRSSSSYTTIKDSVSSAGNASSGNIQFENNEVLLLWLCKLNFGRLSYSITTMNKDKNQGFSYVGEALNIRDQRDSATMLEHAECHSVRGVAANRLMDEAGKIIVIVNVLDYDTLH